MRPSTVSGPDAASPSSRAYQGPAAAKVTRTRPVPFVVAGRVAAVDAARGSVTLVVQGGKNEALRDQPLAVTVAADAVVRHDDATGTLADIAVGDHANVKGTTGDDVYTATRIVAERPRAA